MLLKRGSFCSIIFATLSLSVVFTLRAETGELPFDPQGGISTVAIDNDTKHIAILPHCEYYHDETGTLELRDIQKLSDEKWRPVEPNRVSFGYSWKPYWFRFRIQSKNEINKNYLFQADLSALEFVEIFTKGSDGSFVRQISGAGVPMSQRSLHSGNIIFDLPVSGRYDELVYVKIKSKFSTLIMLMSLWDRDFYYNSIKTQKLLGGIYYGLILFLVIYNFFLFLSIRDTIYIYYIIGHLSLLGVTLVVSGDGIQYFWKEHPIIQLLYGHSTFIFFTPAFIEFALAIFNLKKLNKNLFYFFRFYETCIVAFTLLYYPLSRLFPLSPYIKYGDLSANFTCVLLLLLSVYMATKRVRMASFYLPALSLFLGSIILRVGALQGWLPMNNFTFLSYQIGSGIEAMVMSLALADRINVMKHERSLAQEEAIANRELAIENLKQANRIKDEFLANVTHDLRTPLQGIIGLARSELDKFLENNVDTAQNKSASRITQIIPSRTSLSLIVASSRRLLSLVNNILDHARLKNRDLPVNPSSVNLHEIVEHMTGVNRILLSGKPVELTHSVSKSLPFVRADYERVMQIIQNLIGNAIRFTDRGYISISAEQKGGFIEISVTDTGKGINENMLSSIFDTFTQTDEGQKRGGMGIGLAITKRLVELQGGEIGVESTPDKGSRFYFTLPVGIEHPENRSIPHEHLSGIALQENISPYAKPGDEAFLSFKYGVWTNPGGEPKILIVDDEPINLQVIYSSIVDENYNLMFCGNGEDALEIIENNPGIDLVLLDVMLPGISGLDACREIRKKHDPLDLPVMLLTIRDQNEDLSAGLAAGANDYLLKPFEKETLLRRVSNQISALKGRRAERKRIELEKKQSEKERELLKKEREDIYADLHDHLGARLTDLRLLSDRLLKSKNSDTALLSEISENVKLTSSILRERMLILEDMAELSENFGMGLRLVLLRRYNSADRILRFNLKQNDEKTLEGDKYSQIRNAIFSVTGEIATNDLKYGRGESNWEMKIGNNMIYLSMTSNTNYDLGKNKTGMGTSTIQRRINELGGTIKTKIGERYRIEFSIPV